VGIRRFSDLRAWQAALAYKRAVYAICRDSVPDGALRQQLERSVAGPPAHIAEGFGRFNPVDFSRFLVIARASLTESQTHLLDAEDRGCVSRQTRNELNALAETVLQEVTGHLEYLQSPEALRHARRAREGRIASRPDRKGRMRT
jgi:four helix bundle protein